MVCIFDFSIFYEMVSNIPGGVESRNFFNHSDYSHILFLIYRVELKGCGRVLRVTTFQKFLIYRVELKVEKLNIPHSLCRKSF